MIPADVLRSTPVALSLTVLVAASAALSAALFVGTYFLQDVQHLDPLQSSLRGLPLAALMVLGAPVTAVLLRRYGPRRTMTGGMLLLALGVALLSRLDAASTGVAAGGCFLLMGAGYGAVMVTATAVVVRHAPVASAGVAGGLKQTALNVGPVLGVAAATTLMALNGSADSFVPAMSTTLAVVTVVTALGALAALRLPGRPLPDDGERPSDHPAERAVAA